MTSYTYLTPEQVEAMCEACWEFGHAIHTERNAAIVALLYDAGVRSGEIGDLDRCHYSNGSISLPFNGDRIDLDLGDDTIHRLDAHLDETSASAPADPLFTTLRLGRLTSRQVRKIVKKAAETADVHPHRDDGSVGDPVEVSPSILRWSIAHRVLAIEEGNIYDLGERLRYKDTERLKDKFDTLIDREEWD